MSGDHGPEEVLAGCVQAIKERDVSLLVIGDPPTIEAYLEHYPHERQNIEIVASADIITMKDTPAIAVRKKKNSSVVLAAQAVAAQKAFGFFSPGNTGATLAAAIQYMGRLKAVKRPALGIPFPRSDGGVTFLLDAGANVDSKPEWLVQFAVMGEVYSREILEVVNPKIGLLANGEEDSKGNAQVQSAFEKMKKLPYDFIGNVEGRDIYGIGRKVDVVVCDGFVGNIVLKSSEGVAGSIIKLIKDGVSQSRLAQTGALLLKPTFATLKKRMDYSEYGGVPLLGINGVVIVGHGSSKADAVKNAIRAGFEAANNDINSHIVENIKRYT
jgi:glycerol-3-phosphate acyltransferase PlsX